ncbi:GNAT family N-acetyltransferase [Kiloniella sp. EL199]|uniref:GNAT family N-acetyltransferase n=1 Tax=Kiloniella sp. EL199 TaxID=2107581 RepID=UPI000EA159E4|nr:GNAT family N-acetyltransferase [Kiloniella sp. EL199]
MPRQFKDQSEDQISFVQLRDVPEDEIMSHMSDPRVAEHMPLLTFKWDRDALVRFIEAKEECWCRDGLGHWAILHEETYVGWGGFQKEDNEWDFGLVLKPECFGLGQRITRKALAFAKADNRIPFVTFLLPLSRTKTAALKRLGAEFIEEIELEGAVFEKYKLDTA